MLILSLKLYDEATALCFGVENDEKPNICDLEEAPTRDSVKKRN